MPPPPPSPCRPCAAAGATRPAPENTRPLWVGGNAACQVQARMAELPALLAGKTRILVATSGGPDSQVLLHWSVMAARAQKLVHLGAVGLDHGLRPGAAAELDLAEALAKKLGVQFRRLALGPWGGGNLMDQARLARRRALLAEARRVGAEVILLGHNANDQAETVLQHLARGAGLRGAAGMVARQGRGRSFLRPFLPVTRQAVLAYAAAHHLTFATDPSNADPRRSRAALRAQALPALVAHYPGAVANLCGFAATARAEDAFLARLARRARRRCTLAGGGLLVAALLKEPAVLQLRVLAAWLRRHGARPSRRTLAQLVLQLRQAKQNPAQPKLSEAAVAGAWLRLGEAAGGLVLTASRPADAPPRRAAAVAGGPLSPVVATFLPVRLEPNQTYTWGRWQVRVALGPRDAVGLAEALRDRSAHVVAIAADRPHLCLHLRSWREGDRFWPFGSAGSQSVGNLFTNLKVPRPLRPTWPVVTLADEVVWVVGLRRGCQAPVSGATRMAWILYAEPLPQ